MRTGIKFGVLILFVTGIIACSSGGGGQRSSGAVVLSATLIYPDTTIVDDRVVHIKLNPGPDTLRVRGGQFSINAPYEGEYQLIIGYPERTSFPPLLVSLRSGVNRMSFMIPREEQIESIPADRAAERAGEETRIIIIRP